ncbi:threonine ammonia-lyase [Roseibium sediminis]|uniref:threonine ammonia-lyase n=1 Tax=Roseibium sediminis TaxID=1775174 RepID=UPI00123D573F|nr:threonine ammonia-lyase [Roseibium sediminis]
MTQQTSLPVTIDDIRQAEESIRGAVLKTPCLPAPRISKLTGADVFVKYENMQVTGSFKERGALVKLLSLSEEDRKRGVIAMSAGNHAQGVAFHSSRLGIPATIVMPETTPFVKVAATREFGANVILAGENVDEAREEARRIATEQGLVWVHPFDDPHVISGQGTIALEMLQDVPDLDVLIAPIGGGGLVSGMAVAAKAIKPSIEVIGVETELYPAMWGAVHGKDVTCGGPTIAEGIAVRNVGELTRQIVKSIVDRVVLAKESVIEEAINAYLIYQHTIAEGAGAAALAGLLTEKESLKGKKVGLVLCGGNIDPRLISSIVVRELARGGRMVSIRIDTPDRPGVLGDITTIIGAAKGNVVEVAHNRLFLNVPAKGATLDVTFEAFDRAHGQEIVDRLRAGGYTVKRLDLGQAITEP